VDKSLATELFKEGRALVDQGHVSEGCRKLEESQRLDPGGGTLLNVALCHEKEGRTATAWAEFTEALGIAKRDDRPQRIELAQSHIAVLEPTLSRLVIHVPPAADFPELEIKRDGSVIRRAAWGTAMPVDPGDHVVEAAAQGKIAWKRSVTVAARSDTKTITVPLLENAPAAPALAASPAPTQLAPSAPEPRPSSRAPGWVAMGFGAVGVGVGSYFGLRAMSEQKTANNECPLEQCTSVGAHANDEAIKAANFATVGFAVGIVGVGVGTYLLLTSGGSSAHRAATNAPAVTASISRAGSEIGVAGSF